MVSKRAHSIPNEKWLKGKDCTKLDPKKQLQGRDLNAAAREGVLESSPVCLGIKREIT